MERRGTYRKGNVEIYVERSSSEVCVVKKLTINGIQIKPYLLGHTKDMDDLKALLVETLSIGHCPRCR